MSDLALETLPADQLPPESTLAPQLSIASPSLGEPVKAKGKGRVKFTKENARMFALRAAESRKRNAQLRKDAVQVSDGGIPLTVATERLQMLCWQITRTHAALKGRLQPRDRAQLLLALDRLLERERILRGIPLPGSRRPGRERPQSSPTSVGVQGPLD